MDYQVVNRVNGEAPTNLLLVTIRRPYQAHCTRTAIDTCLQASKYTHRAGKLPILRSSCLYVLDHPVKRLTLDRRLSRPADLNGLGLGRLVPYLSAKEATVYTCTFHSISTNLNT
jgi:hypothetical protein